VAPTSLRCASATAASQAEGAPERSPLAADRCADDHIVVRIAHHCSELLRLAEEVLPGEDQGAALVVTDSGGLQEEAAHYGIPCLVYRTSTERTRLERFGALLLIDPDSDEALESALKHFMERRVAYGDGLASTRIAEILMEEVEV
jgi:hypothetical protein